MYPPEKHQSNTPVFPVRPQTKRTDPVQQQKSVLKIKYKFNKSNLRQTPFGRQNSGFSLTRQCLIVHGKQTAIWQFHR